MFNAKGKDLTTNLSLFPRKDYLALNSFSGVEYSNLVVSLCVCHNPYIIVDLPVSGSNQLSHSYGDKHHLDKTNPVVQQKTKYTRLYKF